MTLRSFAGTSACLDTYTRSYQGYKPGKLHQQLYSEFQRHSTVTTPVDLESCARSVTNLTPSLIDSVLEIQIGKLSGTWQSQHSHPEA